MEMLYRKNGRRYEPIEPFTGFPANGIWLVKKDGKSSVLTVYLDDLDGCDLRVVTELSKKYDALTKFLIDPPRKAVAGLAQDIIALLSRRVNEVDPEQTW